MWVALNNSTVSLGVKVVFKAPLRSGLRNSAVDVPHDTSCILHCLKSSSFSCCTQSSLDISSPIKRELKHCITGLKRREIIDKLAAETNELLKLFLIWQREIKVSLREYMLLGCCFMWCKWFPLQILEKLKKILRVADKRNMGNNERNLGITEEGMIYS